VTRSRFAEDALAEAAAQGTRQAVILGAGLDTFAYRQPSWASRLWIAEVDHPASQAMKLRRLTAAGIAVPPNVGHATANLISDDVGRALDAAGLDRAAPTLVAMLGVMMYLPPEASDRVFRAVARLAPGSQLIVTFAHPARHGADRIADAAAAGGERWLDRPGEEAMAARLAAAGFRRWEVIAVATIRERYFAGRTDLEAPRRSSIAVAST
jgi:methyltransferase (TIGR00027 family)